MCLTLGKMHNFAFTEYRKQNDPTKCGTDKDSFHSRSVPRSVWYGEDAALI